MNNAETDEAVLIANTEENFQAVYALLYPHDALTAHKPSKRYIRIDLSKNSAFYSTGKVKHPIISMDLLMQLLILPTYEAKVVFLVENTTIDDNSPWKKIYEQVLRDSM